MARCGRCGLWASYPEDHPEKTYGGTCLWFQTRLAPDEVFEKRACAQFFERLPRLTPLQHFNYKIGRDNLGDAYEAAQRARKMAYIGLFFSIVSLLSQLL